MATRFMDRAEYILNGENIPFEKQALADLITKHFPDWRRVINELQTYSTAGKIDSGILINFAEENFKELITALKNKNFNDMRKWVGNNSDIEPDSIFRRLYDVSSTVMNEQSIPQLIIYLADYQYKSAFCADHEVNLVACLTEIMADCKFK
jgi:DNA polymerase III delta prime subunit